MFSVFLSIFSYKWEQYPQFFLCSKIYGCKKNICLTSNLNPYAHWTAKRWWCRSPSDSLNLTRKKWLISNLSINNLFIRSRCWAMKTGSFKCIQCTPFLLIICHCKSPRKTYTIWTSVALSKTRSQFSLSWIMTHWGLDLPDQKSAANNQYAQVQANMKEHQFINFKFLCNLNLNRGADGHHRCKPSRWLRGTAVAAASWGLPLHQRPH